MTMKRYIRPMVTVMNIETQSMCAATATIPIGSGKATENACSKNNRHPLWHNKSLWEDDDNTDEID